MASTTFRGDATAVAQVRGANITAYDVTTTYIVTINGKTVSQIGTGGTATTTATALAAVLNASTVPEFAEITWSSSTSNVIGTADTAGVPFTCTASVSGGAGTFGAFSDTTASAGPNDWSTASNWSGAAVPIATNDVYIENSAIDILYGLSQAGATLATLNIAASYTGKIGLPKRNAGGYNEYRTDYLTIDATIVNVGQGQGTGSGRIKLNVGTVANTTNVFITGTRVETALECLLFKGTNAANILNLLKGDVGVAVFGGEVATIATIRQSYLSSVSSDTNLRCGSGVTLTTLNKDGGTTQIESNVVTVTQTDGSMSVLGTATGTTINVQGGSHYWMSSGTITTANVSAGGVLDFGRDVRGRTVTNSNLYAGGKVLDPFKTVTWTNAIALVQCSLPDVPGCDFGTNGTLKPA